MKKLFYLVKHWGLEGWDWMEDGYMQVMYIAAIISELLVLHKIKFDKVMLYTSVFAIHLMLLGIFGYKKYSWEGKRRERVYQFFFFFTYICLIIGTSIFAKFWEVLIILGIPFLIASIIFSVLEYIFEVAEQSNSKLLKWLDKQVINNSNWYIIVMIIIPIIIVGIPLILLKWNVYVKVAIYIAYLLSIPLISRVAKEGMSIFYMFENF